MTDAEILDLLLNGDISRNADVEGVAPNHVKGLQEIMEIQDQKEPSLLSGTRLNESIESIFWPNTEVREPDLMDLENVASRSEISSSAIDHDEMLASLIYTPSAGYLH